MSCPNCGGTVEVRGLGRTLTVVCIQCLSVLDAATPTLQVIQQFQAKERYKPLIPLGTRGKIAGTPYEAIGMQVRQLEVDGVAYSWTEYVLFNPYKGFRYLTEYNGHWNDVTVLRSLPIVGMRGARPSAVHLGETFKHFQNYRATTIYVMGEFPWKVRVGEQAMCDDYISPPRLLSREQTGNEVTWSLGEYTPGAAIWQNFKLPDKAPAAVGIFANQPSPTKGSVGKAWGKFVFWTLVLLLVQLFWAAIHSNKLVFSERYTFTQQTGENSFVTKTFELPGRISNAEVQLRTDLDNNWAYFNLALINVDTGQAFDFSRQVSYYRGTDSDGAWSEGNARDSVVLPEVPHGTYYLRVEPELDTAPRGVAGRSVRYEIKVIRDVTTWPYFWIGILLLLIPPVWTTVRSVGFEQKRWAESDYSGGSSSTSRSGGDDE
ncbi:MAG TPA: DUF4178 domain-containing protein [Bryobacteraceae bacterium]|nr:DUF4178 domain-containing protein [Bryobacteraceae bacterium]